jgi:hypothetical protein
MSATVLTLTVESGVLDTRSSWSEFKSLAVQMGKELPGQALASVLADAQERLSTVELVLWNVGCGSGWVFAPLLSGTEGTLGPGHPSPDVVILDGPGARAGANKNGVDVHLARGLTGRSGLNRRRRAHIHLLGLTAGEDWPVMAAQLAGLPAPALVVLDGETELTSLTQQLGPATPIQRC